MKFFNRAVVNIATTGQGTVTFGSAVAGRITPAQAGAANGDTTPYVLSEGVDWEIGVMTFGASALTGARTSVRLSFIGGVVGTTKMNLAGGAVLRLIDAKEDLVDQSMIDTDGAAAAYSDAKLASQKAMRTYVGNYAIKSVKDQPYNAVADLVTKHDGVITSGGSTLTSATAAFTSADIGKTIAIAEAGAAGVPLVTTIASFNSATSVGLAAAAGATTTDSDFFYGTDNRTPFQSALDGEPAIFVPSGSYLISAGLVITTDFFRLVFETAATQIKCTAKNDSVVKISGAANVSIDHGLLNNPHVPTSTCGALELADAVRAKINDVETLGGYHGLYIHGASVDNFLNDCRGFDSYGGSQAMIKGTAGSAPTIAGLYATRCKFDQPWPYTGASAQTDRGNWAASTAYIAGQIVVANGWYLQCTTSGTSGSGSAPAVTRPFHKDIIDGTVHWQRAAPVGNIGITVDTGVSQVFFDECDATGAYDYGARVRNTLAGANPPGMISFTKHEVSGPNGTGIHIEAGSSIIIDQCTIHTTKNVGATQRGIYFATGFDGDARITKNTIWGISGGPAILVNVCRGLIITDNTIDTCAQGVYVIGAATEFVIAGNQLGNPFNPGDGSGANTDAILIDAVAADYYVIVNNIVNGSTNGITDNGTGSHKLIRNNSDSSADQFKAITATQTGTNGSAAQPWFPSAGGVTVAPGNYKFEGLLSIDTGAGVTSRTISQLFGGTATIAAILYQALAQNIAGGAGSGSARHTVGAVATAVALTVAGTASGEYIYVTGFLRISAAGTVIPQFKYSANPGAAPVVQTESYFSISRAGTPRTLAAIGTWS